MLLPETKAKRLLEHFHPHLSQNLNMFGHMAKECRAPKRRHDYRDSKLSHGLRACPEKADTVLSLPSPRCIKDVQKLNGKLASLNRFLSKSSEKSLPFFKTLKKCTKKSDFQWTTEAEEAFKQMKKLIAELPTLTAPREHEELIIYLAAAKEAISAVLMTDREGRQIPVYFVSRTLRGPEVNYTPMKKLVLALLSASKRLKRYFQAHTIVVVTWIPMVREEGSCIQKKTKYSSADSYLVQV
ncbi:reverse transcriptase domain-containing protein [Tanacetum coccineum]